MTKSSDRNKKSFTVPLVLASVGIAAAVTYYVILKKQGSKHLWTVEDAKATLEKYADKAPELPDSMKKIVDTAHGEIGKASTALGDAVHKVREVTAENLTSIKNGK